VSWKAEFCSCDELKKSEWGTRPQYGLDVCGFCLKPFLLEGYVTDEIIAWRQERNRSSSIPSSKNSSDGNLGGILFSSILIAILASILVIAIWQINSQKQTGIANITPQEPVATQTTESYLGDYPGQTAIEYNFGIACDRIRAGVLEGTADLFREAGTMGEEDGDLDLAQIAYKYADSLDNFDQSETFSECQNY
jgi:hypothetical protein